MPFEPVTCPNQTGTSHGPHMSVCRVGEKCVSGAPADSLCLHLNVNMNVGTTDVWPVPRIFTGIKC